MERQHMQDQLGEDRFAVLGLLCDLQSQVADITREFYTSGGDASGAVAVIADMRRTVDQLATVVDGQQNRKRR
jgi:hypothetical protein